MTDYIGYEALTQAAMRGVVREALRQTASNGAAPGEHHFYISFRTKAPGVKMAEHLVERFPDEMTIVIQHWFDNLTVTDEGFSVTLNFGDSPEPLYIPFDAIRTFVDPSVEFGLRFENQDDDEEDADEEAPMQEMAEPEDDDEAPKKGAAQVVSLDSFRKS